MVKEIADQNGMNYTWDSTIGYVLADLANGIFFGRKCHPHHGCNYEEAFLAIFYIPSLLAMAYMFGVE